MTGQPPHPQSIVSGAGDTLTFRHADVCFRPPLTKIVATLGPASSDSVMIGKLIEAAVSVFRLIFSHGTLDQHATAVHAVREMACTAGRPVAILGDLRGPKIRVGRIADDSACEVATGSVVCFERAECITNRASAPLRLCCT
jgi:pyruvate kinase